LEENCGDSALPVLVEASGKPSFQNGTTHGKNGFVTATKLGTTNKIFVAATKRFVDRTKRFVVVTKCFRYPYFNK